MSAKQCRLTLILLLQVTLLHSVNVPETNQECGHEEGHPHHPMARSAGLQQQDGVLALLSQPAGHGAPGGARAHHDEVVGGAIGRRREEVPRYGPLHQLG